MFELLELLPEPLVLPELEPELVVLPPGNVRLVPLVENTTLPFLSVR